MQIKLRPIYLYDNGCARRRKELAMPGNWKLPEIRRARCARVAREIRDRANAEDKPEIRAAYRRIAVFWDRLAQERADVQG